MTLLAAGGFDATFKWISAVLGLLGLAAALGATFTLSKYKGLAELYRQEAEAQKERGDRIEHECEDTRARVVTLETTVEALGKQVSGADAVGKLAEQLDEQHHESMELFTAVLSHLAGMPAADLVRKRRRE